MIDWELIFARFAEARNWTPEQVGNLTLRQLKYYYTPIGELETRAAAAQSRLLDQRIKSGKAPDYIERAVENLINGKRWDA